ncbi:MAG: coproporphyrinogen III oxidase, partial [Betaproteobacteria bacterium]|nr:coproporphyrinogen III oxidase [Betaproteobacteria bacterium]
EFKVDAAATFALDLQRLKPLEDAGLVVREGPQGLRVQVTPQGRLLVRIVAMQFDGYLHQPREQLLQPRYSRVI